MVLTIFLSVVVCGAVSLMMISAVAFVQDEKMFSSAPKEVQELIRPREKELFYGAGPFGWTLLVFSILMILGALVIAVWDGFRSGFTFRQFFARLLIIFPAISALAAWICTLV